jgi:hypothetical protein
MANQKPVTGEVTALKAFIRLILTSPVTVARGGEHRVPITAAVGSTSAILPARLIRRGNQLDEHEIPVVVAAEDVVDRLSSGRAL